MKETLDHTAIDREIHALKERVARLEGTEIVPERPPTTAPHPLPWDRGKKLRHVVVDANREPIFSCASEIHAIYAVAAANALMQEPEKQIACCTDDPNKMSDHTGFDAWIDEMYPSVENRPRLLMREAWNASRSSCDVLVWHDAMKEPVPTDRQVLCDTTHGQYFCSVGYENKPSLIRWAELPNLK